MSVPSNVTVNRMPLAIGRIRCRAGVCFQLFVSNFGLFVYQFICHGLEGVGSSFFLDSTFLFRDLNVRRQPFFLDGKRNLFAVPVIHRRDSKDFRQGLSANVLREDA